VQLTSLSGESADTLPQVSLSLEVIELETFEVATRYDAENFSVGDDG
jgi:hypothetical protein